MNFHHGVYDPSRAWKVQLDRFCVGLAGEILAEIFALLVAQGVAVIEINGATALRTGIDMEFERSVGSFVGVLNQRLHRENASVANIHRQGLERRMDGMRPGNFGAHVEGSDDRGDRSRLGRRWRSSGPSRSRTSRDLREGRRRSRRASRRRAAERSAGRAEKEFGVEMIEAVGVGREDFREFEERPDA